LLQSRNSEHWKIAARFANVNCGKGKSERLANERNARREKGKSVRLESDLFENPESGENGSDGSSKMKQRLLLLWNNSSGETNTVSQILNQGTAQGLRRPPCLLGENGLDRDEGRELQAGRRAVRAPILMAQDKRASESKNGSKEAKDGVLGPEVGEMGRRITRRGSRPAMEVCSAETGPAILAREGVLGSSSILNRIGECANFHLRFFIKLEKCQADSVDYLASLLSNPCAWPPDLSQRMRSQDS
jgi:hypothetical protein